MNPLTLAMTGLNFALWLNAFNLLGVGAEPAEEGGPSPTKTVGAAGSLIGAITLIFASIWIIMGKPFGEEAGDVAALLSGITGMYGLLWIGVFAAQVLDYDLRPIGNLCLLVAFLQVIHMVGVARILGTDTVHVWIVQGVLATYVVLLLLFWALTYGRIQARPVGAWLIVTVAGTTYLQFWAGGIFPVPQ